MNSDEDMSAAGERVLREGVIMDNMRDVPEEVATLFENPKAMSELMKCPLPIPPES